MAAVELEGELRDEWRHADLPRGNGAGAGGGGLALHCWLLGTPRETGVLYAYWRKCGQGTLPHPLPACSSLWTLWAPPYLHKTLLAQLDGVGSLEEVGAEVEAQLEREVS